MGLPKSSGLNLSFTKSRSNQRSLCDNQKSDLVFDVKSAGITPEGRKIKKRNQGSSSHNNSLISMGSNKGMHYSFQNTPKESQISTNSDLSLINFDQTIDICEVKKFEVIRNGKFITYSSLYKICNMKKISKKESAILAKFCQLLNSCRTEHCQESKLYSTKKSQLMFIQRGLYFITNEVLLLTKKLENKRTSRPSTSFINDSENKSRLNKKLFVQDLIILLNKKCITEVDEIALAPEIKTIKDYLQSVFEYLKIFTFDNIKDITPIRKPRKQSEHVTKS